MCPTTTKTSRYSLYTSAAKKFCRRKNNSLMKNLFFFISLSLSVIVNGQLYTNVNSELCFELYRIGDELGGYRVYIVIDEETTFLKDTTEMFGGWNTLGQKEKSNRTEKWRRQGKRIEAERAPYITYAPRIKRTNYIVPQKVPGNTPYESPEEKHGNWLTNTPGYKKD